MTELSDISELLNRRADLNARLKLLPYDGTPEIKKRGTEKYLYVRKRVAGRLTSTYVGTYSDELYNLLLRNQAEARSLRKDLRQIEKQLAALGYSADELPLRVIQNIDFARANMKANIYDQAVLEGVATTFPQTAEIIDNGIVNGITALDVQKILNLKHAWEFILDRDVIASKTDYYLLCRIAKLVNEGFYLDGGKIRGVPVTYRQRLLCSAHPERNRRKRADRGNSHRRERRYRQNRQTVHVLHESANLSRRQQTRGDHLCKPLSDRTRRRIYRHSGKSCPGLQTYLSATTTAKIFRSSKPF